MKTFVVHPFDDSFCSNLPGDPRPWKDCAQPEHGTLVTCSLCGKPGIEPDEGHVADFLPQWMRLQGRWPTAARRVTT